MQPEQRACALQRLITTPSARKVVDHAAVLPLRSRSIWAPACSRWTEPRTWACGDDARPPTNPARRRAPVAGNARLSLAAERQPISRQSYTVGTTWVGQAGISAAARQRQWYSAAEPVGAANSGNQAQPGTPPPVGDSSGAVRTVEPGSRTSDLRRWCAGLPLSAAGPSQLRPSQRQPESAGIAHPRGHEFRAVRSDVR